MLYGYRVGYNIRCHCSFNCKLMWHCRIIIIIIFTNNRSVTNRLWGCLADDRCKITVFILVDVRWSWIKNIKCYFFGWGLLRFKIGMWTKMDSGMTKMFGIVLWLWTFSREMLFPRLMTALKKLMFCNHQF